VTTRVQLHGLAEDVATHAVVHLHRHLMNKVLDSNTTTQHVAVRPSYGRAAATHLDSTRLANESLAEWVRCRVVLRAV
jgi:hypothetical protein